MSKLWVENISIPNVQWSENDLSSTHDDKSNDIESWDLHGLKALQFRSVAKKIKDLVISKSNMFADWATALTANERKIAAKWIAAPYALRITQYTDAEDYDNFMALLQKTKGFNLLQETEGRGYVIEKMRARVADDFRKELISQENMDNFYYDTKDHIMAFMFANTQDLINWIMNKTGTQYENDGFEERSYFDSTLRNDLETLYYGEY